MVSSSEGSIMDARKRWLIGGVALVVVVAVALAVSTLRSPDEDARGTSPDGDAIVDRTPVPPDPVPPLIDTPTPPKTAGQDSATDPRTSGTASTAKPTPATKTPAGTTPVTPAPPVTPPTTPADPVTPPAPPVAPVTPPTVDPDPDPDPWGPYVEETTAVVNDNVEHLSEVAAAILGALQGSDAPALSALLASDEGQQVPYLISLANRYPTILEAEPGANVNVFAQGEATVYVAYAVVVWRDAGLVSTHTIPLPMRFIDGQWRLTTLLDQPGELVFVTSVTL